MGVQLVLWALFVCARGGSRAQVQARPFSQLRCFAVQLFYLLPDFFLIFIRFLLRISPLPVSRCVLRYLCPKYCII